MLKNLQKSVAASLILPLVGVSAPVFASDLTDPRPLPSGLQMHVAPTLSAGLYFPVDGPRAAPPLPLAMHPALHTALFFGPGIPQDGQATPAKTTDPATAPPVAIPPAHAKHVTTGGKIMIGAGFGLIGVAGFVSAVAIDDSGGICNRPGVECSVNTAHLGIVIAAFAGGAALVYFGFHRKH
jgi:hypothetical protein